jgi:hypothetical protein
MEVFDPASTLVPFRLLCPFITTRHGPYGKHGHSTVEEACWLVRYLAIDGLLLSAFVAGICLPTRCLAMGIHVTILWNVLVMISFTVLSTILHISNFGSIFETDFTLRAAFLSSKLEEDYVLSYETQFFSLLFCWLCQNQVTDDGLNIEVWRQNY